MRNMLYWWTNVGVDKRVDTSLKGVDVLKWEYKCVEHLPTWSLIGRLNNWSRNINETNFDHSISRVFLMCFKQFVSVRKNRCGVRMYYSPRSFVKSEFDKFVKERERCSLTCCVRNMCKMYSKNLKYIVIVGRVAAHNTSLFSRSVFRCDHEFLSTKRVSLEVSVGYQKAHVVVFLFQ